MHVACACNAKCNALRQVVGGGFLFSNPNAKKTCGCSRTFDVKEATMEKAEFAP